MSAAVTLHGALGRKGGLVVDGVVLAADGLPHAHGTVTFALLGLRRRCGRFVQRSLGRNRCRRVVPVVGSDRRRMDASRRRRRRCRPQVGVLGRRRRRRVPLSVVEHRRVERPRRQQRRRYQHQHNKHSHEKYRIEVESHVVKNQTTRH